MSVLRDLMGESSVPLSSLIEEDKRGHSLPEATARNRAALVAIQTDNPETVVPNFQTVMSESEFGSEVTYEELAGGIAEGHQDSDFAALMATLADPNVPEETKLSIIQNFHDSERLTDQSFSLADKALMAPSDGENEEQEMVRLTVVDVLKEYMEQKEVRQGLVNQFMLDNEQGAAGYVVDFAAIMVPGTDAYNNMEASKAIYEALGMKYSFGNKLRDLAAPGFSALKVREHFNKLSPSDQIDAVSKILNAIRGNNAIIAGSENQVRAMMLLERFLEGDYDTVDAVADSVFNMLDIIGLGIFARSGVKAVKAGRGASKALPDAPPAQGGRVAPEYEGAQMPEARVSVRAREIEELEAEHAALLSQQQSVLDPRSVAGLREEAKNIDNEIRASKREHTKDRARQIQEQEGVPAREARKMADKEVEDRIADLNARKSAIEERLRINAETSTATQKIPAIEKRLAEARRDPTTVPARLNPIQDALRRTKLNSVVAVDNAASAGSILMDMNPTKGRQLFKAIFDSSSDDVARSALGLSRTEAIAQQVLPQAATDSGIVRRRVPDIQRDLDIPLDEGGLRFTDVERQTMRSKIEEDFKNANGLTVHDAEGSISISPDGGYVNVHAMYGTTEGGFLRAEDAVAQAKLALRNYGISDDNITVMRRNGLDYEPVDLKDVRGVDGDYKIRITTRTELDSDYLGEGWEHFDVKRNQLDAIPMTFSDKMGSLTRHLFDAAKNLHPNLHGSFSVATDVAVTLERVLLKYADNFAKGYNKLPKERKDKMWNYLLEANDKQIPHNLTTLRARGFTKGEIETLGEFRNFWDMHYRLENLDLARTLRARNFQVLESTTGDKFFARPIVKNRNNNKVYDPSSGEVRTLTVEEMDKLYDEGGTVAQLQSKIDIDGDEVVYIISRNKTDEYLRRVRDDDQILNYREGYFQIQYKAPQYIREIDENGRHIRAVAVRGGKREAEIERARLTSVTGKQYTVTGDLKDRDRVFNDTWDVNEIGGRIAHRRRGERLEGAEGRNMIDGKEFVENPLDSAIRAARSIAGRTVMRPALETAKARFLKQYGHMLVSKEGRTLYPNSIGEIGAAKAAYTSKELRDARTTFEFIKRMESGYINQIDELSKGMFNSLANALGEFDHRLGGGLGRAESAARAASKVNPTSAVRGTVFQALIGLNPVRNLILQPQQVMRTFAYNPTAWTSGDMVKYFGGWVKNRSGFDIDADTKQMLEALDKTGMLGSIDRSNLVRGALLQATEDSNMLMKGLSKALEIPRKIGFDSGEKFNIFGHYAAAWSKYKRSGADMTDPTVLARIHSEARSLSGDFNRAGDFAYTQNAMSMPFQFAQVPHKFLLTLFDRKLTRAERARIAALDLSYWGIPGAYVATEVFGKDILPEDPDLRDIVVSGFVSYVINESLRRIFDDDTDIDFSTMAPYNVGGFAEIMSAGMNDGFFEMLNNTPAGTLIFNGSGRVGAAFSSLFRHFSPISEGLETPETLLDTVNQFAKIGSGWNNATKSWFMLQTGMAVDKYNMPVATKVTVAEAVAQFAGFQPKSVSRHYQTVGSLIDNKERNKTVAKDLAESILQMYASAYSQENGMSPEYVTRLSGAMLTMVEKNPLLAKEVYSIMSSRIKDPDDKLMGMLLEANGMPTIHNAETRIKESSLPEADKQVLLELLAARQQLIPED